MLLLPRSLTVRHRLTDCGGTLTSNLIYKRLLICSQATLWPSQVGSHDGLFLLQ